MNPHFPSARIYAFPSGGRETFRARLQEAHLNALGVAKAPAGSGWYHEAAMQDEERARKPRSTPWWDEAECESQSKGVAVKLF